MSPDLKAIAPKLTKLLLLLLSSDQDNEALTARRKLTWLLREKGLDSHDLVATLLASESDTGVQHADRHAGRMRNSDTSTVGWCHQRRHLLKARDQKFIEDLMTWRRPISDDQRQWLHDIVGKIERAEAA
jgi:hypothetical protein